MAYYLVDLEFRQKAKHMMTRREILAIVLFVLLAMHKGHGDQARDPRPGAFRVIMDTARNIAASTWDTVIKDTTKQMIRDSGSVGSPACNPHNRICLEQS